MTVYKSLYGRTDRAATWMRYYIALTIGLVIIAIIDMALLILVLATEGIEIFTIVVTALIFVAILIQSWRVYNIILKKDSFDALMAREFDRSTFILKRIYPVENLLWLEWFILVILTFVLRRTNNKNQRPAWEVSLAVWDMSLIYAVACFLFWKAKKKYTEPQLKVDALMHPQNQGFEPTYQQQQQQQPTHQQSTYELPTYDRDRPTATELPSHRV